MAEPARILHGGRRRRPGRFDTRVMAGANPGADPGTRKELGKVKQGDQQAQDGEQLV